MKSCLFLRNKSIIVAFNFELPQSIVHNNASSSEYKLYSHMNMHLSLRKTLTDWCSVDYCDVFISCLDSHSDGTHSLQRIYW